MKSISKEFFWRTLPHLIAVCVFVVVAVIYCRPIYNGKVLEQEDVTQWQGMAHNSFEYKETHGHFPLWSNGMFSGMPAYQIAMDTQSVSIPNLFYGLLTLGLKKPANFFFLACICFYFLTLVLRINPYIGIMGALAYAYATYNAVIVAVGHDTKMQTIALMPGVIGSLILICEEKYWLGIVLTTLCTALMVSFNHIQIIYYTMIIAGGLLLGYGIPWIRRGKSRQLVRTVALALGAAAIGVLSNAVALFTTFDSSKETIRGGSELADARSNYTKEGLSEAAAFDFSMYKLEPFVMLVPDIYGGSTELQLPPQKSKAVQAMDKMPSSEAALIGENGPRYYWGGVGEFFSGPPYVGAIIILLTVLGFFILDNRYKWWILGVCALSVAMSWGGYFQGFNGFLLRYLPMYNKFRGPSMILVIPTFLFCLMAAMTLQKILVDKGSATLWRRFGWGLATMGGIFLVLAGLYFRFDYSSAWEQELLQKVSAQGSAAVGYMTDFVHGLRADRQQLFQQSLLRSLGLVLVAALAITLYLRLRLWPALLLGIVGILSFADVLSMDVNYLNNDNYKENTEYQQNFAATNADREIMADKDYYRVFDLRDSMSNALTYGAMTAYFHHSIGGYHAARLSIYEDLINRQLFNFPNCAPVLNMLNTKYIIQPTGGGGDTVVRNRGSLGPVWFVRGIRFEPTPASVMDAITHFHPKDTAILFSKDSTMVAYDKTTDTTGFIQLIKNDNDEITYRSDAPHRRFAVFSEVFYKRGWRAWIDDKQVPIFRTNYVLRGLSIPQGHHIIRFFFRPLSFYLGRQIQWMASIIFLLMLVGMAIVFWREHPGRTGGPPAEGQTSAFPGIIVSSGQKEECEPLSNASAGLPLQSKE
jgi:hypothetical protein